MKHCNRSHLPRRLTALVLAVLLALPSVYASAGDRQLQTTRTLADGLNYVNTITWHASAGRVESYALELDADSGVQPILLQAAGTVYGTGTINLAVSYAQSLGYHVLGAINTDYFTPANGIPMGIVIEDGVYKSSPEGESAMTVTDGRLGLLEQPQVILTLTNERDGAQTALTHLNKLRADSGGLYLLNHDFSVVSTRTASPGWMVRMRAVYPEESLSVSGTLELEVVELFQTDAAVSISEDEYILTAADASGLNAVYEGFQVGDRITLSTSCDSPELEEAQWAGGTGDVMIRDGQLTDSSAWIHVKEGRAPRSALGVRADGTAVLYAVDGRQNGYSGGLSQIDLAQELLNQGCDWAVNLDGGGSTAMSVWVPGQSAPAVVNSPSDGKPRGCATYLLLVSDDPGDGQPHRLALKNDALVVLAGTSVDLGEIAVLDSGLNVLSENPGDVEIDSLRELGELDGSVYTAGLKAGTDTLELWSDRLNTGGSAQIHVVEQLTGLTVSQQGSSDALTALHLEPGDQVQLTAQGTYWSRPAMRDLGAITWTVSGNVGDVTADGLFTATGSGGTAGTITASAGGQTQTISITLQNSHVDVPVDHWAYTAVDYCYAHNLVGGISSTEYGPDLHIRRGDFLLMLYSAAGRPAVDAAASFTDVSPSDYYYTAVAWAQANGLTSGVGDGSLAPGSDVTREQAFTILNQTLPLLGITCQTGAMSVLDQFGDRASLSDWAAQHAATLVAYRIVGGDTGGNLNPKAYLSRAEMAALLYKLSNYAPPADLDPGDLAGSGDSPDPVQPEDPNAPDPGQPEDPGQTQPPADPVPADGIALDQTEVALSPASSYQFKAVLTPDGATTPVTWTSSHPALAPVAADGAIINLNTSGSDVIVTVTATAGDNSAAALVYCQATASVGVVQGAENGLNVRSGPGTDRTVIGALKDGDRVMILDQSDPGWLYVAYVTAEGEASIGYVSRDYVALL